MDKHKVLGEIRGFLDGFNNDLKYVVNVETDPKTNLADCVIHEPNQPSRIQAIRYEPFMYMKDLSKFGIKLYENESEEYAESKRIKYGVTITKLKTGNQKRLIDGYCYKLTGSKSYQDIQNYLIDGGVNPREKLVDDYGEAVLNEKGEPLFKYRDMFFSPRLNEQFFISTGCRLYKGFEEYKNVHKLTFDIETTGLRFQISRIFAIGVRDNRGFETILEVDKFNDDESEIRVIQDFFNLINYIKPAIISGFNSEMFDFEFILGRAKILKMNLSSIPTTLNDRVQLRRKANTPVKYGSTSDKYTSTEMWGMSVIDIMHAAKKTAAMNSDLKEVKLKYIAKFEKIAKPNRTYIDGEDNKISKYFIENKVFVINDKNEYVQIPDEYQEVSKNLYKLQANKSKISDEQYKELKNKYLKGNSDFVKWFKSEAMPKNMINFIGGRKVVRQYLLDDLWETEHVDELYNQSSFMLAKIVPTTYQRICTMGTAGIWNLLLTTWSYENDLAIPISDKYEKFSGGLARCFKTGYSERIVKIDYASLYPMIQLTDDVFPFFDITGVIKKLLLYLTTTRNIYKKLANSTKLDDEEVTLLNEIDHEIYVKYINDTLTSADIAMSKVKQLPIKILNNSLFGALGSNISFNWSDNTCAARITCTGRLHLRHAINWFSNYNCVALLAVTDGINFSYPIKSNIKVVDDNVTTVDYEDDIDIMWQYHGEKGITALIDKFNAEVKSENESVTFDSPIYIKDKNNNIDIIPICEMFNNNSSMIDDNNERDYENKDYKVLTKSGWSNVNYVFKHKTNKNIHRIETKNRLINITEDHSIFQNGNEVKPSTLKRNDKIDVIDIPKFNMKDDVDLELAWLYGFFFGDGHSTHKKRFKIKNNDLIKNGNRKVWKISNTNLDYLNKCVEIFHKEYGIKLNIIDRRISQKKSNNVLPLYEIVSFDDNISEFFTNEFYTSYGEKKIPKFILNATEDIKRMFIFGAFASDGYYLSIFDIDSFGQKSLIGITGFAYLLSCINVEYSLSCRKDKENFINIRFNTVENKKFINEIALNRKTDKIWNNTILKKYDNGYVYDISTEDETFVSGIGGILCHNTSGRQNYIMVDNDGESLSCLNLSRINYGTLALAKDKKTGEIKEKVKLTGNTIKSKIMPEYIEEFIDKGLDMILHGKGKEFVEYYYSYCEDIRYMQIPLKKIASKSKIKISLNAYSKRGKDKNGRDKGMQAHMELLLEKREKIIESLFNEHVNEFDLSKHKKELTIDDKLKLVANYMPQEPELDSVVYYVNSGYKKSHGDSRRIIDKVDGKERFCATLISNEDLHENPNMLGTYNYEKYLDAFNKRVESLLVGFEPEVAEKILVKINKNGDLVKGEFNPLNDELRLKNFDSDDYGEAMRMEDLEIDFWNKTGYDPRKIWNGFTMPESYKVHYEIYENALKFLNDKMVANNKQLIKSINDEYVEGDLVLIKDGSEYNVAKYNGVYMQIIKANVEIPKSEIELELDRIREENQKKIDELTSSELVVKTDRELFLESQAKKNSKYFADFKKKFNIGNEFTMESLFEAIPDAKQAFESFINMSENAVSDANAEYMDVDDGEY